MPPTRFDRVLGYVAFALIVLTWGTAICLCAMDDANFLYFLFAGIATLNSGLMFLTVRYSGKLRIKMPVVLDDKLIIPKSALILRCLRWLGVTFSSMGLFMILGWRCIYAVGLQSMPIMFLPLLAMICILVYYTIRISRLK